MKKKKSYGECGQEESKFNLSIPERFELKPPRDFIEVSGGGGYHNFQQYAQHCLTQEGNIPTLSAFKANFTAWSLEGTSGVILYPEGPAFKVLGVQLMEGDPPVTYEAEAANFTALMLCIHPTVFPPEVPGDGQLASYEVTGSWEPNGPMNFPLRGQNPIDIHGEIFKWKHVYFSNKVSFRIKIIPSPTGRNTIYLAGRLGTKLELT